MEPDKKVKILYILVGVLLLLLLCFCGYELYQSFHKSDPKVLTPEQVSNPYTLSKKIQVTEPQSTNIIREIERTSGSPNVSYYVESPGTYQQAASQVAKDIDTKKDSVPAIAIEKTDRTVVSGDEEKKKVDVYKINLSPKTLHSVSYMINPVQPTETGTILYEYSRRVHESGKYIGVVSGYDFHNQQVQVGIKYTW